MVRVELLPAVTEAGPKDAVAPDGTPLTLRLTDSAEPLTTAVLIVTGALPPWANDTLVGFAPIEKLLPAAPPHPGNLNDAMRVLQLNVPFAGMYSVVNQNVQSSTGSIDIDDVVAPAVTATILRAGAGDDRAFALGHRAGGVASEPAGVADRRLQRARRRGDPSAMLPL